MMRPPLPLRLLLAVAVSLGLALTLLALLYATDLGFRVWGHLRAAPGWLAGGIGAGLLAVLVLGGLLLWRVLRPKRPARAAEAAAPEALEPPSEEALQERVVRAEERGIDVAAARAELERLRRRREAGEVHVALLGEVSTGKSSLVVALLPDAQVAIDPRAGTTRRVDRYTWESRAGDRLILSDLPGLDEPDGRLSEVSREEALRAQIVVYLVDGDLTRQQYTELREVMALEKPVILALNKADLYSREDLATLRARLTERAEGSGELEVVSVSAATEAEVVRVLPNGREMLEVRRLPPRVAELTAALQRRLDRSLDELDRLRDAAVFVLAARKLDDAVGRHRREQAARLVSEYTHKAVVAAMAAVSPGTDLLIQGYLGVRLVRALCETYEAPTKHIDVERLLQLVKTRFGRALPLSLAVAGNAFKAFPGVGTLAGGALHAVAYGLLFDGLGRAVAKTLETRGELPLGPTLRSFEEQFGEAMETRARRIAGLVIDAGARRRDPSSGG